MDNQGEGHEICIDNLNEVVELDFSRFHGDMFLMMCILSGCDYVDSIKGIGLKKAHKLVRDQGADLKSILRKIRMEGKQIVPNDYESTF